MNTSLQGLAVLACSALLSSIAFARPQLGGSDDCSTPTAISGTGTFPFDASAATTGTQGQGEALCNATGGTANENDVWFTWTAPDTGRLTVALCGSSSLDAKLAVYPGSGCPTFPALACADDVCGVDPSLQFAVAVGQSYTIQIGSHPGTAGGLGSFTLAFSPGIWNRRPAQPVLTPGATPGTWDVAVGIHMDVIGSPPVGIDLGYFAELVVNGVVIGGSGQGGTCIPATGAVPCPSLGTCSGNCTNAFYVGIGYSTFDGVCTSVQIEFNQADYYCQCRPDRFIDILGWGSQALNVGDLVQVQIMGASASEPELETLDDLSPATLLSPVGPAFCFGDGTATACPCGNSGAAGNGCAHSLNPAGANLVAAGNPSLSVDSVTLLGSQMPNSSALYFQGTSQLSGGAGVVFGDGLRCAGGAVVRLATVQNAGGASQYPQAGDPPVSVRGGVWSPATRTYQVWYRNAAAFCTSSTFNLTNGFQITWSS